MDAHYITLEIDYEGRGCLEFELPADATDDEIAYFRTLVPRVEQGLLEMLDPETSEVVFSFRPRLTH
jgi:hypothetical protein